MPRFLPAKDFAHIVRHAPLVSIDLLIRDQAGNVLVGLRRNRPAQATYFVPGGIIRKNETISAAFGRIIKTEVGLTTPFHEAKFIGVFEHFYDENTFGRHTLCRFGP